MAAGYVNVFCNWDWSAAEREFQRPPTLNPACAEVRHMRAHYLEMTGRFETAQSEIHRAMDLEPGVERVPSGRHVFRADSGSRGPPEARPALVFPLSAGIVDRTVLVAPVESGLEAPSGPRPSLCPSADN